MKEFTIALLLLFAATSFAKKEKSAKGENLLLQLESNFAADVAKHGHDAFLTYFAEDGVELVDGRGINTQDAMRKQPPWPEGTTLSWTPRPRRNGRFRRSRLHLRQLRLHRHKQRGQACRQLRQVHLDLEEAEERPVEGSRRHGNLQSRSKIDEVITEGCENTRASYPCVAFATPDSYQGIASAIP